MREISFKLHAHFFIRKCTDRAEWKLTKAKRKADQCEKTVLKRFLSPTPAEMAHLLYIEKTFVDTVLNLYTNGYIRQIRSVLHLSMFSMLFF